jgi:hypothetical protein
VPSADYPLEEGKKVRERENKEERKQKIQGRKERKRKKERNSQREKLAISMIIEPLNSSPLITNSAIVLCK